MKLKIKLQLPIHIGRIRKIFRNWRILICAWVDDNSSLKSQFFAFFIDNLNFICSNLFIDW